jgi:hypothetical protein
MMAEPDGPQRQYARDQAEWIREQLGVQRAAGAAPNVCNAIYDALGALEHIAENAREAGPRMSARAGIEALAGMWLDSAPIEAAPVSPLEHESLLGSGLHGPEEFAKWMRQALGADAQSSPTLPKRPAPPVLRGRVKPDPDDRLPRGRRNVYIGCHETAGTWIHGEPHSCPRWARR